jgi:hypothetical protein
MVLLLRRQYELPQHGITKGNTYVSISFIFIVELVQWQAG